MEGSNQPGESNRPISDFVQQSLAYTELLSCSVTTTEPKLARKVTQIYCKDAMAKNCNTVVGLEPWLLVCLTDIMTFRHWKEDQLRQSSLSIAELAKKAMSIEQSLDDGKSASGDRLCKQRPATDTWVLTNVFACGASILLHATISEARPQVLEIKNGVSDLIEALHLMSHPEMLKRLSWPICM
jgi:hypothetical protein